MELRTYARQTLEQSRAGLVSFRRSLSLSEISGAFGDIGTFLPLLVGFSPLPKPWLHHRRLACLTAAL